MVNKGTDVTRCRMQRLIDCKGLITVEGEDIVIRIPLINSVANRVIDRLSKME